MQSIQELLGTELAIKGYRTHIHRFIDKTKDASLVTRIEHKVKFMFLSESKTLTIQNSIITDFTELVKDHRDESDEPLFPGDIKTFKDLMLWDKTVDATFSVTEISESQWFPVVDQPYAVTDTHPDFSFITDVVGTIEVITKLRSGLVPNSNNVLSNPQIHRIFTDLVMRGYTNQSK